VEIQVKVLRVVMPYIVVIEYQHLRGPCCLCFQDEVTGDGKKGA